MAKGQVVQRDLSVVVDRVSKSYETTSSNSAVDQKGRHKRSIKVDALKDISFVARKGESVGVIGQNGSGKSTLFRIMSGKDSATTGDILVSSEPTLLGVAAAMQRHLTGIQNVELGCLAMGMKRDELEAAVIDVKEFCDLGDAIYRPMSTYSSGMGARLKFAIATCAKPEILLVDEALSTGDAAFNERAQARMKGFLGGSGTVFVVSHSPQAVADICERALWLHLGELIMDAPLEEVAELYKKWARTKAQGKLQEAAEIIQDARSSYSPVRIRFC